MMESGVAITGSLGNLGTKLACHLAASGFPKLVGLDVREDAGFVAQVQQAAVDAGLGNPDVKVCPCDLTDPVNARWRSVVDEVGGVVHFAARNPYPEATWGEASASLDMTVNTALAASTSSSCARYVIATSNHVMGRYRTAGLQAGGLSPECEEGVGTVWSTGEMDLDSTPYASAKFAGERVCHGLAAQDSGTDYVCVRIGWCQPGENEPETLSAAGTPTQAESEESGDSEVAATDRWFKEMWLSNRDMVHLFERALVASSNGWSGGFALVHGMSNNRGMVWDISSARALLGYEPVDDVYEAGK